MVVVIDYGLGNTRSVIGAVKKLGFQCIISSKIADLERAEKLILPGVGAFADGMNKLRSQELIDPLTDLVLKQKKPILGICLGFQLMAKEGHEFGTHAGLGWINAQVERLPQKDASFRIPHMGWNHLIRKQKCILFEDLPEEALFYFANSYHVKCSSQEIVAGSFNYGIDFVSVVNQDNIFGTQFHPEKSQNHGLTLLGNFLKGR